jgi:chondroitin AC lyase
MVRQYCIPIFFFLLTTWSVSASTPNDDISVIRQRVLEWMVWPSKENISITAESALNFTQTLNSSCFWPDLNYADRAIANWNAAVHVYRITTMVQALTVNGSSVQNDPQIRTAVHCALNAWLVNDWQNPNWWFNQINIPLHTTSQLLMLGDNVTSFEIEKIKEISFRSAWWLLGPQDTGANLVWMLQVEIYRSLATNNITGIEQAFARMWQDVAIRPANQGGMQFDWSYHFHGQQLLSGSYGWIWAQNIFSFIICSDGTAYEISEQQLSTIVEFMTKGDAWMIIGKNWDWHVIGREIARPDREFRVGFHAPAIRKLAELVQLNDTKVQLINLADRLDGQANASLLIGNKHFFVSDFQVHRRNNWTSALTMQSIRTNPIECINGENQKAEHYGQGVLNLYSGNAYDYDDIFPVIDYQAINGITVEHDIPLARCTGGIFPWRTTFFVGGVSDGQYGLAMMDTATHNLTAKRSWHFYDDAIIALATNLTLTTQNTAWTALASRLLPTGKITIGFFNSTVITISDGNYSFPYAEGKTSNVQWIHIGESDIAYLLQGQQQYTSIEIDLGVKTGNYLSIGPYNGTVTVRIVTIAINHGFGPYTLGYNYMILPNVSLESVPVLIKQYNEEQVFSCISTNNLFHGTVWPSLKRASFVLWDDIATTFSCKSPLFEINIELSASGAYLFSESTTDFTLTASHPIRVGGNVKVTVDRVGTGEGCTASSDDNAQTTDVTIALPPGGEYLGASVNVKCKK